MKNAENWLALGVGVGVGFVPRTPRRCFLNFFFIFNFASIAELGKTRAACNMHQFTRTSSPEFVYFIVIFPRFFFTFLHFFVIFRRIFYS